MFGFVARALTYYGNKVTYLYKGFSYLLRHITVQPCTFNNAVEERKKIEDAYL